MQNNSGWYIIRIPKEPHIKISGIVLFSILQILISCRGMENPDRPILKDSEEGSFITVRDGTNIFFFEFVSISGFKNTIYIISGITGINHKSEKDIIEKLSNNENRIVVIHPRGTGYSEGKRGDYSDLSDFILDYAEIIKGDRYYRDTNRKMILFGHSMSCLGRQDGGHKIGDSGRPWRVTCKQLQMGNVNASADRKCRSEKTRK